MSSGRWPMAASWASSSCSGECFAVSMMKVVRVNSLDHRRRRELARKTPFKYATTHSRKTILPWHRPVRITPTGCTSLTCGEVQDTPSAIQHSPQSLSQIHHVEPNQSKEGIALSLLIHNRDPSKLSLRKAYRGVPERPGLSSLFGRSSHGLTQERDDASAWRVTSMLMP